MSQRMTDLARVLAPTQMELRRRLSDLETERAADRQLHDEQLDRETVRRRQQRFLSINKRRLTSWPIFSCTKQSSACP